MSLLDDGAALDPTTPWAPKVPLAPPPEAPAAKPTAKSGQITPETHPHYFPSAAPAAGPQAVKSGADDYMATVRQRESGGNDMATNGVAYGRYQFTLQTWLGVAAAHPELGLRPEDIWNGEKQDQAMRAFTADNARILQKEGFDPTSSNLRMLHFLGTGSGPKFLKAMQVEPTSDAAAMFPLEAKYNPTIFFRGGDPNQPRTLSQVYGMMTRDFGGTAFDATPTKNVENSQPQVASDVVSDATNDPSLPPGAKLVPMDEAAEISTPEAHPLPPGAKLVPFDPQEVYDQDVGKKNPYDANISKGGEGKPVSSVDEIKEELREVAAGDFGGPAIKRDLSQIKGLVSGVLQSVTGSGELLPDVLGGGKAAEATRTLQGYGDPEAQKAGTMLSMLVPLGGGVKAAGTTVRALVEEGPSLAKWGEATWQGLRGGGLAGAMTPTGEADQTARAKSKLEDIGVSAGEGGVVAGAIPAAAGVWKWGKKEIAGGKELIGKEISNVWGGEARRLSQELRSGVSAETGKALTAEERTAKLAQIDKLAAKKDVVAAETETAAHREKIAAEAAKPVSTPEALGEQVHETAVADMEALKAERAAKSGFDKAVKSDGGAPSVPTSRFVADAKAIEADTKSSELKAAVSQFRKSLTNAPSVKGRPAIQAVSIRQAREILETLNKHISEMEPNAAHRLTEVRDDFFAHLEKTHPQMKAAREAYARLSRPLDVYERTGALKKAAMEDPYSGGGTMDPVKIKAAVTGKTQGGAEALQRLIQKNPAIRDSVRNVLQGELYGIGNAAKAPSAENLRTFLKNNRIVLEKTGLDKEFEAIKPSLEAVEAAPKRASETERAIKDLAKTKADAVAARSDLRRLEIEMNEPRNTPKQIVSAAETTAKKLYARGAISETQYQKFFSDVREAEQKNIDHEHAVRLAKTIAAAGLVATGGAEVGQYIQHRIRP